MIEPADRDKIWAVSWVDKRLRDQFIGAVCICREGILVTSCSILPMNIDALELKGRFWNSNMLFDLTVLGIEYRFGLAVFKVKSNLDFPWFNIAENDVTLLRGDPLHCVIHRGNRIFTLKFGFSCRAFPSDGVVLPDFTCEDTFNDESEDDDDDDGWDSWGMPFLYLRVRDVYNLEFDTSSADGVSDRSGSSDHSGSGGGRLDSDHANVGNIELESHRSGVGGGSHQSGSGGGSGDSDTDYGDKEDMVGGVEDFYLDIPVIQVHGFDCVDYNGAPEYDGSHGCPVFTGDGRLVGLYFLDDDYYQYVMPVNFIHHFVTHFLPIYRQKLENKISSSKHIGEPLKKKPKRDPDIQGKRKPQGRLKGVTPKYNLKPLVPRLSEIKMENDCIGEKVEKLVSELPEGCAVLMENVPFYKEGEKNDPESAKKLAALADVYVNDAFGAVHTAHASTEGVAKYLKPSVACSLMQNELEYLVDSVANPKKPFCAIVGASKVLTKIGVIESLLAKVDYLLLGGEMIFTSYKAQGNSVGSSLVEEDKLDLAKSLTEKAKANGVHVLLPTDVVIANKFAADAESKVVPANAIPDGWMGLDIEPDAVKTFSEALDKTQIIIWNGPMGVFEFEKFAVGTETTAKQLPELSRKGVTTITGGGDLVGAVEKVGLANQPNLLWPQVLPFYSSVSEHK